MNQAGDGRAISAWLRRFKWSLAGMPSPERDEIVAEVRAHLMERIDAGDGVTDALNAFGRPEAYARSFMEEMELARAITGERVPSMLGVVIRRAHRSAIALAAFLGVLVLVVLAVGIAGTAIHKMFVADNSGLWVGNGSFYFGLADESSGMRELLGLWLYPLTPLVIGACWVLGRLILLSTVRSMRSSR